LGVASREYVLAARQNINIKPKFHTSGAGTARHYYQIHGRHNYQMHGRH
jgi:hypothetical protein